MRLTICALLCCGFFPTGFVSAEAENHFRDQELGVSISVPTGWSRDLSPRPAKSVLATFTREGSEILLQSGEVDKKGDFDLLEYAKFQVSNVRRLTGAEPLSEPEKVTVGNREAVVTLSEGGMLGLKLTILDYCFYDVDTKRVYHLRLYSPEGKFEIDKPDFLSVVNSFTIQSSQ